jgi:hypothetical protein
MSGMKPSSPPRREVLMDDTDRALLRALALYHGTAPDGQAREFLQRLIDRYDRAPLAHQWCTPPDIASLDDEPQAIRRARAALNYMIAHPDKRFTHYGECLLRYCHDREELARMVAELRGGWEPSLKGEWLMLKQPLEHGAFVQLYTEHDGGPVWEPVGNIAACRECGAVTVLEQTDDGEYESCEECRREAAHAPAVDEAHAAAAGHVSWDARDAR